MSTARQIEANRSNAAKSTGPKSARGKSRSAGNARTHGLTTPPAPEAVTRWYRIIRNDVDATPDPLSRNVRDRAALVLAEAEARLQRVCAAESENRQKMHNYIDRRGRKDILEIAQGGFDKDPEALEKFLENQTDPFLRGAARILLRYHPNRPAALRQDARRFARYRREAEAQRRRALDVWIGTQNQANQKTKRTQLQL
jgi:hypothetical protein